MVVEVRNVKDLTPAEVDAVMGGLPELVVIDVSFVGLSHIFPVVASLTSRARQWWPWSSPSSKSGGNT